MQTYLNMERWTGFAPEDLRNKTTIVPIPSGSARVIVTIDGLPYAGFKDRVSAEEAVRLWSGTVNGGGFPVGTRDRETSGWPAVRGRQLAVLER